MYTWKDYLTPSVVGAGFTAVCATLTYLLNHRAGRYTDSIKDCMDKGFANQTAALTKTGVECKDEIVAAIKESKIAN